MMRLQVMKLAGTSKMTEVVCVRPASLSDLKELVSLDEEVTGLAKPQYWKETFARHGVRRRSPRFFLVAERRNRIEGFIIAEVREWEFGEPPCGWILAIQVRPRTRLKGVGTQLFEALCNAFRRASISKVRTLLVQDDHLVLSFFRSQGMMAGPFIELETVLD
jgi:GNAT superfamily N-acetyltransferase